MLRPFHLRNRPGRQPKPMPGRVHIFRRRDIGWITEPVIDALGPAIRSYFGTAVAVSGELAVIGASRPHHSGRCVHVFQIGGGRWRHEATLRPSNKARSREFGCNVDIEGGTVAVSSAAGGDQGVAIFHLLDSTWSNKSTLSVPGLSEAPGYCPPVSLRLGRLLVGGIGESRVHS